MSFYLGRIFDFPIHCNFNLFNRIRNVDNFLHDYNSIPNYHKYHGTMTNVQELFPSVPSLPSKVLLVDFELKCTVLCMFFKIQFFLIN